MIVLWIYFCLIFRLSLTTAAVTNDPLRLSAVQPVCYSDNKCYVPRPGFKKFPESPEKVNTQFFLYTRKHRNSPGQSISATDLGSFNPMKPIKLIIHGFTDKASNKWVIDMKEELLTSDNMTVIAVDWSGGNQFPYDQAVANTVIVASAIHGLLQAMIQMGVKPQQIHFIGHSLGAHISGYVGRLVPNLGRISGLDPAGPDFYTSDGSDRLDPSDALFVDVIHTNGAAHAHEGFGHSDPLGHVDFYPNGGSVQPTCGKDTADVIFQSLSSLISTWNMDNAVDSVACNHMSAVFYYTSSINSQPSAVGYPCSDYKKFEDGQCTSCDSSSNRCQPLGYHASPNRALGKLYLMTLHGVKPPHFGTHFKVILKSDTDNEQQTRGTVTVTLNGHPDILLLNQNTIITPNFQKSMTILLADYPVTLEEISISFRKSFVFSLGFGLADQWRFRPVTILDMTSNQSYKFCPISAAKIKSGSHLTFKSCN